MDRVQLVNALNDYITPFHEEKAYIPRFKSLLSNFTNCYDRSLVTGHITASAWIINSSGSSALMVHHKKLNRWLQPGGHADGDENIVAVATREASEESGLKSLKLFQKKIFDLDIHQIPEHQDIQSHFHHDIRFLFVADKTEEYIVSDESNELRWVAMEDIGSLTENNASINRMVLKTRSIFI